MARKIDARTQLWMGKTLVWLEEFESKNGFAPCLRELAESQGLGSPSAAFNRVKRLEELGCVVRTRGLIRGIQLTDHGREEARKYRREW